VYVDIGAGDPTEYSVTKLFYDRGWSGINVEPGPAFAELAAARSRDVNLNIAVALEEGTRDFWISSPHAGISTFHPEAMGDALPEGFVHQKVSVECMPLRRILEEHLNGRAIDFMTVDVEGAEAEVIRSIDFKTTRPTVLVVEAIAPLTREPSHEDWEPVLLEADYTFAAFDGINRFYVELSHRKLLPALAYPISILDGFATHESQTMLEARRLEAEGFRQRAEELQGELTAVYTSRLWRAGTAITEVANPLATAASRLRGLKRVRPIDAYKAATAPRQAWHFPRGTTPRAGLFDRLFRAFGPSDSAVTASHAAHIEHEVKETNWSDETSLLEHQLSWEERQAVVEADALGRSLSDRPS
jgi:FkbM family methyltransferase